MRKKGSVVLPVILFIIILGLVGYILINNEIIIITGITKDEVIEEGEKKPIVTELETDNANVKALIKQIHNPSQLIDELIFVNGGSPVSEMSEEYKFSIATNTANSQISTFDTPTEEGYYGEISEEVVTSAYERLFGTGTYKAINSFNLGCLPVTYDSANKRYVTTTGSCGVGTTPIKVQEEILSITKTEKQLIVVTAVLFYDPTAGKLYKDSSLTKDLGIKVNDNLTEESLKQYILDEKEQLEQYTYTFDIGTDGFYYYTEVKRTQE